RTGYDRRCKQPLRHGRRGRGARRGPWCGRGGRVGVRPSDAGRDEPRGNEVVLQLRLDNPIEQRLLPQLRSCPVCPSAATIAAAAVTTAKDDGRETQVLPELRHRHLRPAEVL